MPAGVRAALSQVERMRSGGIVMNDNASNVTYQKGKTKTKELFRNEKASEGSIAQQKRRSAKIIRKVALNEDEYFARDSSFYGDDNYSHMSLVKSGNQWVMTNVYSLGDSIIVNVNTSTGIVTIPIQKATTTTYGDVYICPAAKSGSQVSYSTSGNIQGILNSDGTITIGPWGLFIISGQYRGSVMNAFGGSYWHPSNATMITYNQRGVQTSYKTYVEQSSNKEVRVYNFTNTGNAVYASLASNNTLRFSPQEVYYTAKDGAYYYYPLDTTKIELYTDRYVTASQHGDTISLSPWVAIDQQSYKKRLITANRSFIVTDAKFTWPVITSYSLSGNGTVSSPYLIATAEDLKGLADNVTSGNAYTGKYFTQTADIDLSSTDFHAIGDVTTPFGGFYDGNGHTIKGFYIEGRGFVGQGLFGVTAEGSILRNINIANANVKGSGARIGTLVGNSQSRVENCYATNSTVSSQNMYAGGLIGFSAGKVYDCYFSGNVSARGTEGGLIGYATDSVVSCHSFASVDMSELMSTEDGGVASALVGVLSPTIENYRPAIVDSYASGQVSEQTGYGVVGGTVGVLYGADMRRCFNVSNIVISKRSRENSSGALVGTIYNANVADSYNAGTLVKNFISDYVGGLVGYYALQYVNTKPNLESMVTNCYNSGLIRSYPSDGNQHRGIWGSQFLYPNSSYNPSLKCFNNCYTDTRITVDNDTVFGTTTTELTSGTLPKGFSPSVWTAQKGFYPQLKSLAGKPVSDLSVAAAILSGDETIQKVKKPVTLTHSNQVTWKLYANGSYTNETASMKISGDTVRVTSQFGNNALSALTANGEEKMISLAAVPNAFDGSGTADDPYLIHNLSEMIRLDSAVAIYGQPFKGDYFRMTNDIDCEYSAKFRGIGAGETENIHTFDGTFDGSNHYIHRLRIKNWEKDANGDFITTDNKTYDYGGLFRYVGENGCIRNIRIADDCQFNFYRYSGSVVGYLSGGRIENVRNYANIRSNRTYVGGIVGQTYYGSVVTKAYNAGNIINGSSDSGGIVAYNMGTVSYSQNDGNVSTIFDSTSTAYARAQWYAGGISGSTIGTISNCCNNGIMTSYRCVGGITGSMTQQTGRIEKCLNNGLTVQLNRQQNDHGGVVGSIGETSSVASTYYDKSICTEGAAECGNATGAYGIASADLVSGKPLDGLSTDDWDYQQGMYPVLKLFKDEPLAIARRQVYVKFTEGTDRDDVQKPTALASSDNITWRLYSGKNYTVGNGNVALTLPSDTSLVTDTLVATYGGRYSKFYPLASIPRILEGVGTTESPYLIKTTADYDKLAAFIEKSSVTYKGKHFLLVNDLDFSADSTEFRILSANGVNWEAEFNGNGKSISGYSYTNTDSKAGRYLGLFGNIGGSGYVHDLSINGTISGYQYIGGLVGNLYGTVRNVVNHSSLKASAYSAYIGGIAYKMFDGSLIDSCLNASDAKLSTDKGYIGGIAVETSTGSVISNSANEQPLKATSIGYIGGIAYRMTGGIVRNCKNSGDISGTSQLGGIVGTTSSIDTIANCVNTATITGTRSNIGGILAYGSRNAHVHIANCHNVGAITGNGSVGGIGGNLLYTYSADSCYNEGVITSTSNSAGGLFGQYSGDNDHYNTLTNSWNKGDVSASGNYIGGLIGTADRTNIYYCHNVGNVIGSHNGNRYGSYAGGIAGSYTGTGYGLWNAGDVTVEGNGAGGIGGIAWADIDNCFNAGNISASNSGNAGNANVGGLWGYGKSKIRRSYNLGTLVAPDRISGINGRITDESVIDSCYNAGAIRPTEATATALRHITNGDMDGNMIINNYYDVTVNPTLSADELGTGMTTNEMYANTALGEAFTTHRAAYPTLNGIVDTAASNYFAAGLQLQDGDTQESVTKPFYVGNLGGFTWTASDGVTIGEDGIVSAKAGNIWVKKSIVIDGITFEKTYNLNVKKDITGIESILSEDEFADHTPIFDLAGQYMGTNDKQLSRGVYIRNGKKFIVK